MLWKHVGHIFFNLIQLPKMQVLSFFPRLQPPTDGKWDPLQVTSH